MRSRFGFVDSDPDRIWSEMEFHLNISVCGNRRNLGTKGTWLNEPVVRLEADSGSFPNLQFKVTD